MNKFDFQSELKTIIDKRQLVEIDLNMNGKLDHFIAYLIDVNEDYITFARISNDLALQGVTMCLLTNVQDIQVETKFVAELRKGISDDSLNEEAKKEVENVREFTFKGFFTAFEGTETLIDINLEGAGFTGRVVGIDDSVVAVDEYYAEESTRFSRTFINPLTLVSVTVGGTWLKIIARSLVEKNV